MIGQINPPATEFTLPSLDNLVATSTAFEVQASDSTGTQLATAEAHLNRRTTSVRADGDLLLQYFKRFNPADGDYVIARYQHAAGLAVSYVDYDVPTNGARKGRVHHEQIEDALYWDNGNLCNGCSPAEYPTVFESSYWMTPYVGGARTTLTRTSTTGLTSQPFYSYSPNNRIANGEFVSQYAQADSTSGTVVIDDLNATTSWPPPRAFIISSGALVLRP